MGKQENCSERLQLRAEKASSPESVCVEMPTATLLLAPVVARKTSYEEVIHRSSLSLASLPCPVTQLAGCLAEWLVVLQGVSEDRGPEQPSVSCRCDKASWLCEELQSLGRRLTEAGQVAERVGQLPPGMLDSLNSDISSMADTLRSEVSILIPSGVGQADPEVSSAARWLVCEGDLRTAMGDTVEGLARIVTCLLGVEECLHHPPAMEEGADEDIMSLVASMCGGGGDQGLGQARREPLGREESVGKQVLERSRKRKQTRPSRSPGSPCSPSLSSSWGSSSSLASPVKRVKRVTTSLGTSYTTSLGTSYTTSLGTSYSLPGPAFQGDQGGEVLGLLEKKKKLMKKDGLYKFVLWREALRDEKTKMVS